MYIVKTFEIVIFYNVKANKYYMFTQY